MENRLKPGLLEQPLERKDLQYLGSVQDYLAYCVDHLSSLHDEHLSEYKLLKLKDLVVERITKIEDVIALIKEDKDPVVTGRISDFETIIRDSLSIPHETFDWGTNKGNRILRTVGDQVVNLGKRDMGILTDDGSIEFTIRLAHIGNLGFLDNLNRLKEIHADAFKISEEDWTVHSADICRVVFDFAVTDGKLDKLSEPVMQTLGEIFPLGQAKQM